jgi:hypothetical protein
MEHSLWTVIVVEPISTTPRLCNATYCCYIANTKLAGSGVNKREVIVGFTFAAPPQIDF